MPTADEPGDDDRVWRCRKCGTRQPTPQPPCERCWHTTFVSGDGADDVAGRGDATTLDPSAVQAAQVRTVSRRSAALSALLATGFGGVRATLSLGTALEGLVVFGLVATAAAAVAFLVAAVVAAVYHGPGVQAP